MNEYDDANQKPMSGPIYLEEERVLTQFGWMPTEYFVPEIAVPYRSIYAVAGIITNLIMFSISSIILFWIFA